MTKHKAKQILKFINQTCKVILKNDPAKTQAEAEQEAYKKIAEFNNISLQETIQQVAEAVLIA